MKIYLMKVKSLFVKRPEKKLSWNYDDYRKGKKWAETQPHPFKKNKTLWELVYDKNETVRTIENLNKFLFNEI